MDQTYLLGIDTGGTYTDAVLFREETGVVAKAKALTTRHDLSEGIAGAVDAVLGMANVPAERIGLVSLSTTLATNALVEGQGGRAALVMVGFAPEDLARDGLAEALGPDPVIFLEGGHDVHGTGRPLQLQPLQDALGEIAGSVSAIAVAGYFAVRNPAHEIAVRQLIRDTTSLPVTCSHELSSKLGGPRRALTTLLNARLVGILDRLIGACESFLARRGIAAPLVVVRGDGALISAAEARLRPIETILSGPAASLVGARYLTGFDKAVVSDIGGTTTDIAILDEGRPALDTEGASVGGYRTMVEAVALHTFGLGGDSQVHVDDRSLKARLTLGPRRLVPLCLAAWHHADLVVPVLERQLAASHAGRHDGRFAMVTGLAPPHGLTPAERALFDRIDAPIVPLDRLLSMNAQQAQLNRLVSLGIVHICGITPSDALHVLGRQGQWNEAAARLGLSLASRRKDGAGNPIAASAEVLAGMIVDRLTRQSGEAILAACLPPGSRDAADPGASPAIAAALDRRPGVVRLALSLDRPLIGLGASAPVYYPAIANLLGAESIVPADADVANAIGAVVGQVRSLVTVLILPADDGSFRVSGAGDVQRFDDQKTAFDAARACARSAAEDAARRNGADTLSVVIREEVDAPEVEGTPRLVEARIIAMASGRPRFAGS